MTGGEAQTSPENLLFYTVRDGSVYVRPELNMLLDMLGIDLGSLMSRSDGDEEDGEGEEDSGLNIGEIITKLLPTLNRWTSEGIRFNLVENDPEIFVYSHVEGLIFKSTYNHAYAGNYKLYLDEVELEFLIDNFDLIMDLLDLDLSGLEVSGIPLGSLLTPILNRVQFTKTLNLGLYLHE